MTGYNQSVFDDVDNSLSASNQIQVVRESHGSSLDYLQEHNAANLAGEASFLKEHAHQPFADLALFCVNIAPMHNKHVATTGGDTKYANYASCQTKKQQSLQLR